MAFLSSYHQNFLARIIYSPRNVLVEKRAEEMKGQGRRVFKKKQEMAFRTLQ